MFIYRLFLLLLTLHPKNLISNSLTSDFEWEQFMFFKKKYNKTYPTFFELENKFKIFSLNLNTLLNFHLYNDEYPIFLHKDSDAYHDSLVTHHLII